MSQIYTIFEQLASDNSRLAKEAILIKNKNNELLKRVFHLFTISPDYCFISFRIY